MMFLSNPDILIFVFSGRNRACLRMDGRNTVSFLVGWPEDIPANKVGWCQPYYDEESYIIAADIIFNMKIARFNTPAANMADSYYVEGVLAHKIGYMIGLEYIEFPSEPEKQAYGWMRVKLR